jgi:hypothetical protein
VSIWGYDGENCLGGSSSGFDERIRDGTEEDWYIMQAQIYRRV